ncbi:unnamed protein product [Protopolystoma xenopodis]|uniref:Uncharacterized protein n=1 Tax=Protopolystoma xenopodis TaxID=117903 RepID=A0A3S5CPY0_9PLAT|nr:unnamed protein product [Protopolystoma xenopodis]
MNLCRTGAEVYGRPHRPQSLIRLGRCFSRYCPCLAVRSTGYSSQSPNPSTAFLLCLPSKLTSTAEPTDSFMWWGDRQ